MEGCKCHYDVLLLNPSKRHSKKTITKSHSRISQIINESFDEFSDTAIKLVKEAAKAINSNRILVNHDCEDTQRVVKIIKEKIFARHLKVQQAGKAMISYYPQDDKYKDVMELDNLPFRTNKSGVLVPYINNEDNDEVTMITNDEITNGIWPERSSTNTGTSDESSEMEVDKLIIEERVTKKIKREKEEPADLSWTSDPFKSQSRANNTNESIDELNIKVNKTDNTYKMNEHYNTNQQVHVKIKQEPIDTSYMGYYSEKQLREANMQNIISTPKSRETEGIEKIKRRWIQENRKEVCIETDEITDIIGHYYKFEQPRFKCQWSNGKDGTTESLESIIKISLKTPGPLRIFLKKLTGRAFKTLVERAPELIITLADPNRVKTALGTTITYERL